MKCRMERDHPAFKNSSQELTFDFNFEFGSLFVFLGNFFNFLRFSFLKTHPPLFSTTWRNIKENTKPQNHEDTLNVEAEERNWTEWYSIFCMYEFSTDESHWKNGMVFLKSRNTNMSIYKTLRSNLQHHYSTDVTQCVLVPIYMYFSKIKVESFWWK